MYKVGTVNELVQYAGKMDNDLYAEAFRVVKILDDVYGANRDVCNNDGGFCLIAENFEDVELISRRYKNLESDTYEAVDIINGSSERYIVNVYFLNTNEFGINVIMPLEIAPKTLLKDLPEQVTQHK